MKSVIAASALNFAWLCVSLSSAAAEEGANETTDAATRPNIIIILCDDMGAHELGLYGHPRHKTPALDELGRKGIWFTTGYATPICHPTRFRS